VGGQRVHFLATLTPVTRHHRKKIAHLKGSAEASVVHSIVWPCILSFLRHSNSDRLSLFMRKSRKILLSDQEVEGSLDQDVDDYEDSRIELQAIGLNLVGRHSFCSAHLRLYI
jgi:hypothetical protein